MASGLATKLLYELFACYFRASTIPTNFYLILCTDATAPTADAQTVADLMEITAGNGYTAGGTSLTPGAVDFDSITQDDANDLAKIQIKNVTWTAAAGAIPSAGDPIRYAVLTDDNVVPADRLILAWNDLGGGKTLAAGDPLTLKDFEMRLLNA